MCSCKRVIPAPGLGCECTPHPRHRGPEEHAHGHSTQLWLCLLSCGCGPSALPSQLWNMAHADSESELQGADPIGYACVKRSNQSKKTCKGSS
eukprot:349641-Chlamydomonas_euryale.AAC.11